jgi:hypothetical protein
VATISRAADLYYTFRFLKVLVTPWKEMDAYKAGIIDENGKNLIRSKQVDSKDKDVYTTFHRLVFNIKRILEKIPFGKSKLASYAAALFLLKEETGMSEENILKALEELGYDTNHDINESMELGPHMLDSGRVVTLESIDPIGQFAGVPIYKTIEGIHISK